jgi:hypothetical protein
MLQHIPGTTVPVLEANIQTLARYQQELVMVLHGLPMEMLLQWGKAVLGHISMPIPGTPVLDLALGTQTQLLHYQAPATMLLSTKYNQLFSTKYR